MAYRNADAALLHERLARLEAERAAVRARFKRMVSRRRRRMAGWLAFLVAIGAGSMCVLGAVAALPYRETLRRDQARRDTETLAHVTDGWRGQHGLHGCPTLERLRADGAIARTSAFEDPWGTRYEIECAGDDTIVRGAGPDRKFGTPDDAVATGSSPL